MIMNRKTCAVIFHRYLRGGAERVTETLVGELRKRGFRFVLLTNEVAPEALEDARHTFDEIRVHKSPIKGFGESDTRALAEAISPLMPDIVWLIGDDYDRLDLLRPAMAPGGKIIFHLHSVPFFQVRLKTASGFRRLKERLLHTYSRRYQARTRSTATDADAVVTLCEGYARQLRELYPDLASKFISIYNPVKPVAVAHCEKRREVAYVGRLSFADKRVDNLLRIFAKVSPTHPGWTLRLIGDGPERQKLELLVSELGIADKVDFAGYVDNPVQELASASILCLTSDIEGWGMALVEAMQTGVVPMAFNCSPGVAELLADGRGALITPGNLDAYAAALADLMDDPDRRAAILATHPQFLASLDLQTISNRWATLFNS